MNILTKDSYLKGDALLKESREGSRRKRALLANPLGVLFVGLRRPV